MNKLHEIVKTQDALFRVNLHQEIEHIFQSLDQGNHISRKKVKLLFSEINKSIEKIQNPDIQKQYNQLCNNAFRIVYQCEKDFVQQKINIRKFIRRLKKTQEQYRDEIVYSRETYSKILDIDLTSYVNAFKLNTDIINRDIYENFVAKISVFRARIIPEVEKNIYKNLKKIYPDFVDILNDILKLVDSVIDLLEKQKQRKTQQLASRRNFSNPNRFVWESDSDYLDHMTNWKNDFVVDEFLGVVGQYISWKYPVAYFDPNIGELTRHIISGDPFYIIDNKSLPFDNIVGSLPEASQYKMHHYTKASAKSHLEPSSVGVCVSWNNFGFLNYSDIHADLELMSMLTKPGGHCIFNYVDAHSFGGAKFVEQYNDMPVLEKSKLKQDAHELGLTEVSDHVFFDEYPFKLAVYRKHGKPNDLGNLASKLGLVLPKDQ